MGSMLSGLFGGGSSPGQQQQTQAIKASRADIQRLRPELMQAKLNALRSATEAYQGTNNALETLWGDPNAKPMGAPQRMMGHDLPQGPSIGLAMGKAIGQGSGFGPRPQRAPSPVQQGISFALDPLNLFKGR